MPEPFGDSFNQFNHSLIAPLWTDFDPSFGAVYYRITNDSSTSQLQAIVNRIREINVDFGVFSPEYAVIISWVELQVPGVEDQTVSN